MNRSASKPFVVGIVLLLAGAWAASSRVQMEIDRRMVPYRRGARFALDFLRRGAGEASAWATTG